MNVYLKLLKIVVDCLKVSIIGGVNESPEIKILCSEFTLNSCQFVSLIIKIFPEHKLHSKLRKLWMFNYCAKYVSHKKKHKN